MKNSKINNQMKNSKINQIKNRHRLGALVLVAALAVGASACAIEVDPGYGPYVGDLRVDWRIHGSQAAGLCDAYAVSRWVVTVSGPESRELELSCHGDYWSSESDFFALSEGLYSVEVRAFDGQGGYRFGKQASAEVVDDGLVQQLTFNFAL